MDINSTSAATLLEKVALLEQKIAGMEEQQNNYWLLSSAFSIFFMQAGFLLLEAGSVMSKNVKSIMMKNLLDTFGGGLAWYICGFYVYMYFADQNATSLLLFHSTYHQSRSKLCHSFYLTNHWFS